MIGISFDGLFPILIISLSLLILLPFLWFKLAKWQRKIGLLKISKTTYFLAYTFLLVEVLLAIVAVFIITEHLQKILFILALPISALILALSFIVTYFYTKYE